MVIYSGLSKERQLCYYRTWMYLSLFAPLATGLQSGFDSRPKTPPRYFRLHREADTGRLELQTAKVAFRARNETQIDLYSLVHIADARYYHELKQDLALDGYVKC